MMRHWTAGVAAILLLNLYALTAYLCIDSLSGTWWFLATIPHGVVAALVGLTVQELVTKYPKESPDAKTG